MRRGQRRGQFRHAPGAVQVGDEPVDPRGDGGAPEPDRPAMGQDVDTVVHGHRVYVGSDSDPGHDHPSGSFSAGRLPSMNSPTLASRSGSRPVASANASGSPPPSPQGPIPIAVAARYIVW